MLGFADEGVGIVKSSVMESILAKQAKSEYFRQATMLFVALLQMGELLLISVEPV
jgi:hypothetical protein